MAAELSDGQSFNIFGFICLGTLIILTFCGNLLILIAILKNRRLRTASNLLIINMALADILYSLSTLPMSMILLYSRSQKWPLRRLGNVFFDAAWLSFLILSFLNVQVITLDRYLAITKPYIYERIATNRRTIALCCLMWIYVLTLVGGLSSTFRVTDGHVYKFLIPGKIYYSILIFHAVTTCATTPVLYNVIYHVATRHRMEIMKQKISQISGGFLRELKATWTIGFVIYLFLSVWLPFLINQFVDFHDIYNGKWDKTNSIMCYVTYCNGPVNIFLYSLWNREIRKAILKLFRLAKNQRRICSTAELRNCHRRKMSTIS